MSQTAKDHRRRERLREYDGALGTARAVLGALALFVRCREARAHGGSLEEAFAATSPTIGGEPLPAAVWVALRQDDVEAALAVLLSLSGTDFVVAAHEQLDGDYRLVSVEESRPLPDLDRLIAQLSAFLQVPADVIVMVADWGPDDPRTVTEIEALLAHRFGVYLAALPEPTGAPSATPLAALPTPRGNLLVSADEFGALLTLSPEQRRVLATLVRQATITVTV
ncbi:MAG: hypothetical protein J0H43_03655 [Actinobacteria bacterium]|nr:hypothetical protein [Actinomycetota bacterium]